MAIRVRRLLSFLAILPLSANARPIEFELGVCEVGTSCGRCKERAHVTARADVGAQVVELSTIGNGPTQILERLKGCTVLSEDRWECKGFRGILSYSEGRATLSPALPPVQQDGVLFEPCAMPVAGGRKS